MSEAETSLHCLIYWIGSLAAVTGTGVAVQGILSPHWTTSIWNGCLQVFSLVWFPRSGLTGWKLCFNSWELLGNIDVFSMRLSPCTFSWEDDFYEENEFPKSSMPCNRWFFKAMFLQQSCSGFSVDAQNTPQPHTGVSGVTPQEKTCEYFLTQKWKCDVPEAFECVFYVALLQLTLQRATGSFCCKYLVEN